MAQDTMATTIQVSQKEPVGDYLTDSEGRSLYLSNADKGKGPAPAMTHAQRLGLLLPQQASRPVPANKIDASKLGSVERKNVFIGGAGEDPRRSMELNGGPIQRRKVFGELAPQVIHDPVRAGDRDSLVQPNREVHMQPMADPSRPCVGQAADGLHMTGRMGDFIENVGFHPVQHAPEHGTR